MAVGGAPPRRRVRPGGRRAPRRDRTAARRRRHPDRTAGRRSSAADQPRSRSSRRRRRSWHRARRLRAQARSSARRVHRGLAGGLGGVRRADRLPLTAALGCRLGQAADDLVEHPADRPRDRRPEDCRGRRDPRDAGLLGEQQEADPYHHATHDGEHTVAAPHSQERTERHEDADHDDPDRHESGRGPERRAAGHVDPAVDLADIGRRGDFVQTRPEPRVVGDGKRLRTIRWWGRSARRRSSRWSARR